MFGPRHGNTRFNPTSTGDLHLGHVYLCLVNQHEAYSRGGQFFVRFDDTQLHWAKWIMTRERLHHFAGRMLYDLDWLGVQPDRVVYQSDIQDAIHRKIEDIYGTRVPPERNGADYAPVVVGMPMVLPMCYTPAQTMERVMMDFYMLADLLIRGMDLLDEFALYAYWCEQFRIHHVYHAYLPRLLLADGEDPDYYGTVNKTGGVLTVRSFREQGYSPDEIRRLLALACLKDPQGPWAIDNVKERPVW